MLAGDTVSPPSFSYAPDYADVPDYVDAAYLSELGAEGEYGSGGGYSSGSGSGSGAPIGYLEIGDAVAPEGNVPGDSNNKITFTVLFQTYQPGGFVAGGFDVSFSTHDFTAVAGEDFVAPTATMQIHFDGFDGEFHTFDIVTNPESTLFPVVEDNEMFGVFLSISNAGAPIDTPCLPAIGTILNDDSATVSIVTPNKKTELNGNLFDNSLYEFTVQLSARVDKDVVINYSVNDISTTSGEDYNPITESSVTISAGSTVTIIIVTVVGDTTVELDETFEVSLDYLTGPFGEAMYDDVSIGSGMAVGTIENDDIAYVTINEHPVSPLVGLVHDEDAGPFEIEVRLSSAVDHPVSIHYETIAIPGSATPETDYTSVSGIVTLSGNYGDTTTFSVPITPDNLVEAHEKFRVRIRIDDAGGRNVEVPNGNDAADVWITNDDTSQVTVAVSGPFAYEGDVGEFPIITFVVSLSNPVDKPVTVDYQTNDGSAISTGYLRDYLQKFSTPLTFTPGETQKEIHVKVVGDDNDDDQMWEYFTLDISDLDAGGYEAGANPTVTLEEDLDGDGIIKATGLIWDDDNE